MGYVEDSLSGTEALVFKARFHWLYTAQALLALLILGIIGVGIVIFFVMMIRKWTTEIAVTSSRLIIKTGWIARKTEEMGLRRVEEVNLDQSVLGRIFGYGKLTIHGTGHGELATPNIDDPLAFRHAINEAKQNLEGQG